MRRRFLLLEPKHLKAVLAVLACLLLAGASEPAQAQFDPFGWFEQLFTPKPQSRTAKPKQDIYRPPREPRSERPRASREPTTRAARRPAQETGEGASGKAAEKPAVPPSYFVAVLGDSLADLLARGLSEAFESRPEVAILRKAKDNSGLVRDDFYDWIGATKALLEGGEKIDFAVIMIGSNDRQVLHDGNGNSYEPRSPEWQAAYTQRIETIAAMFRDKKIPLVWVGLPVLKSEKLSADALLFNDLYRASATKAGATYVDVWEAFAGENGEYQASGPDINGQIVRLRTSDGIHFTKAGARKLAHFVEPEIRRNLDETHPQSEPTAAPVSPPAVATAPNPEGQTAPAQEAPPAPKPIAGPVLTLTGAPLAPKGELVAPQATAAGTARNEVQRLIDETLRQGKPLAPKPGRADDFSWPRE